MQHQIAEIFQSKFNNTPSLFFAPGRINLLGEHVDYNDGYVLPAAIDKGIWFALAENNTNSIRCFSADMNEEMEVAYEHVSPRKGWQNYILGVIHVLRAAGLQFGGVDCVFGGNLPVGAGLSSSAAVECGLAYGLNEIFRLGKSRKELALLAQQAEHLYPGVKCGIMDQYASLLGKKDNIIMLDCLSIEHQYIPFQLQNHSLVLINSNVQHALAGGEYNLRRSQCAAGLQLIRERHGEVNSFREVTPGMILELEGQADDAVFHRCRYVVAEIERTRQAAEYLTTDRFDDFGQLMFATHEGLSRDYEVSCVELDFLVEQAKKTGVTGARLMGGGFGGCTINLVEKSRVGDSIEKITKAYHDRFGIHPPVLEVAVSDRVHRLT